MYCSVVTTLNNFITSEFISGMQSQNNFECLHLGGSTLAMTENSFWLWAKCAGSGSASLVQSMLFGMLACTTHRIVTSAMAKAWRSRITKTSPLNHVPIVTLRIWTLSLREIVSVRFRIQMQNVVGAWHRLDYNFVSSCVTASVAFMQMLKNLETQDPELVAMSARVREYFLPQLGDPKDN